MCLCAVSTTLAADIETTQVLLRGVDKVTGRTTTITADINQPVTFGNLMMTVQKCLKKPPEEMPENAAFLTIEEKNRDDAWQNVFNGWMFSSNPALSAMEHPIYDIWVLECLMDKEPVQEWEVMVPLEAPMVQGQKEVSVDTLNEAPLPEMTESIQIVE